MLRDVMLAFKLNQQTSISASCSTGQNRRTEGIVSKNGISSFFCFRLLKPTLFNLILKSVRKIRTQRNQTAPLLQDIAAVLADHRFRSDQSHFQQEYLARVCQNQQSTATNERSCTKQTPNSHLPLLPYQPIILFS